jgi:Domain of unknown function (DUF4437)
VPARRGERGPLHDCKDHLCACVRRSDAEQRAGEPRKLSAGSAGAIRSDGSPIRAVFIQGQPSLVTESGSTTPLQPGSYFDPQDAAVHSVACDVSEDCVVYVRPQGKFDVTP